MHTYNVRVASPARVVMPHRGGHIRTHGEEEELLDRKTQWTFRSLRNCMPPTLVLLTLLGTAVEPKAQDVARTSSADGGALYAELCALCHGVEGEGYAVEGAPALGNQDFLAVASDEFLFEAIARGRPGTRMSPWSVRHEGPLDDEQIKALVSFARSWQTVPSVAVDKITIAGSSLLGMQIFRTHCAECHGEHGEGNSAPSLNTSAFLEAASDGYIRYAVARGRRGTPMAAYGSKLTSQEIDGLVALIRSWEK